MATSTRGRTDPAVRVSRIVAPTDFSPGAEPALQWAMHLAKALRAEVTIMHVMDLSLAAAAGLPTQMAAMPAYGDLLEHVRRETKQEMAALAKRYPDATTIIREGPPRSVILEVAKEIGADLIVMGTHGRTGLAHVFFGSVAEHVVRHSPVPVLTVRQKDK